jgi:hypothetical protein
VRVFDTRRGLGLDQPNSSASVKRFLCDFVDWLDENIALAQNRRQSLRLPGGNDDPHAFLRTGPGGDCRSTRAFVVDAEIDDVVNNLAQLPTVPRTG